MKAEGSQSQQSNANNATTLLTSSHQCSTNPASPLSYFEDLHHNKIFTTTHGSNTALSSGPCKDHMSRSSTNKRYAYTILQDIHLTLAQVAGYKFSALATSLINTRGT